MSLSGQRWEEQIDANVPAASITQKKRLTCKEKTMSFRRQHRQTGTGEASSRWAWPPMGGGGRASAANGPRGGSLSALDLLDRSADEPDVGWPQTEAELAKFYQSSIMDQQQRHLEPLREDLADWLNKILGEFSHPYNIITFSFSFYLSFRFFLSSKTHCRLLHVYIL